MKLHALQSSFAAGQLSPLMGAQVATEGYQSGVALMENFYANSRGPALSRHGTTFIKRYTGVNKARVITLQVSSTFFYIIVLINLELKVITPTGAVLSDNRVNNPRFATGGTGWTDVSTGSSTVDFQPNFTTLTPQQSGQNRVAAFQQSVSLNQTGNHTLSVTNFGSQLIEIKVGSAAGLSDLAVVKSQNLRIDLPFTTSLPTVFIETSAFDDDMVVDPFTGRAAVIVFEELSHDSDIELSYVTPWLEADIGRVHVIPDPSGNTAYFVHPNYPPYKISYDNTSDSFQFTIVTFANPPLQWGGSNWPATGVFHQGRLWLAATPNQGETFWGSTSTDPEDFDAGTGLDDEAIQHTLAQYGVIRWMSSTKNLLLGTASSEHIAVANSGVLTPSDVDILTQSSYGSAPIQSTHIGDQVIYMSAGGRKVLATQYAWSEDNWLSKDLTYISENITRTGIISTSWMQNPHNLFWCVLGNGDAAAMTYERTNNTYGWHYHTTQGSFLDFDAGQFTGAFSINAIAATRVPGSVDIEFMGARTVNMDSTKTVTNQPAANFAEGYDHLEGMTVQVLTDAATHPDRVVGEESLPGEGDGVLGRIYLQRDAVKVTAGLGYNCKMVTLPYNQGGGPQNMGSYKKRYNKLFVMVDQSSVPLINGVLPKDRYDETPMGTPEPLRTVNYEVATLGWTEGAVVTIEQPQPLQVTVLGIFGEVNLESL